MRICFQIQNIVSEIILLGGRDEYSLNSNFTQTNDEELRNEFALNLLKH